MDFLKADSSNLPEIDFLTIMEYLKGKDEYTAAEILQEKHERGISEELVHLLISGRKQTEHHPGSCTLSLREPVLGRKPVEELCPLLKVLIRSAAMLLVVLLSIATFTAAAGSSNQNSLLPQPCPSEIFCHGPLLHTVQMASIYKDSKTFVDMKLKRNSTETLERFEEMMNRTGSNPTPADIVTFVEDNFDPAGSEFEDWIPTDWRDNPLFLENINDRSLKNWAGKLHEIWKILGRKMKEDVKENEHLYSIIYVPHPVIVPGGRFREFYYWDSYWIVRGLLLSEMYDTVKGMMANFLSIVERYGLIPNGGRIYYQMRSQPPLLIPMFDSYLEATDDLPFLEESISTLEKEFYFWMRNHTTYVEKDGHKYRVAVYKDESWGPRPESYREDVNSAQWMATEEDKNNFYSELKSAAESGWDFSTRWFINQNGSALGNLTHTKVKSIVPVDLNAIIYWNAKLLAKFYMKLNITDKANEYQKIADEWILSVEKILWHDEVGSWLDYDMINHVKRDYFYPSNLAPLWTGCYDQSRKDYFVQSILKYLDKTNLKVNVGGIPTTVVHSGEQWDYPNAWPPLQYMVIMGLEMTGDVFAKKVAYEWAEKWVRSNYEAFRTVRAMFEKYDATVVGETGGGGEYEVQLGFGWTNGVIMELLHVYGDRLRWGPERIEETVNSAERQNMSLFTGIGNLAAIFFALTGTLAAGVLGVVACVRCQIRPSYTKLEPTY